MDWATLLLGMELGLLLGGAALLVARWLKPEWQ